MKSYSLILTFFVLLIFSSCRNSVIIYYYNLEETNVDDGEIWGGTLFRFFLEEEKRIETKIIHSKEITTNLNEILKTFKNKKQGLSFDDGYYEYAFIFNNNKDTLYTNRLFEEWSYKDRKLKIIGFFALYSGYVN